MTPAPRCACALALLCLLSLLLLPERTAGDVLLLAVDTPRPRVARWLNLGPLNKYVEKIFSGSSKKYKTPKKTADTTKFPPTNATKSLPPSTATPRPPASSQGPR
nr:uncharacterized protein LOC103351577 isoform X2 [Oryctolagus cuniculus]